MIGKRTALSLFFTVLFLLGLVSVAQAIEMVSVDRPKINMRSGPGTNHSILWELGKGYPLMIIGRQDNWLKVRDFEGDEGWVYQPLVGRTPYLVVKVPIANIRSGPGTRYRLVGQARYGVVLHTLERGSGWVKVRHENGLTGWMSRDLLWGW
ncbi:SH3 domain-containing protein [Desulfurivibrio dismutans]|uniref:SH3 domain-containing protein n=1 Tax=Desulfurivibrio dismutans TaxID=1398908 RepID=UPI0023DC8976|nr:SH3 domain-containing protein [Desulfurivibrio alkaliphilus]MDF1615393.1 SH3 domain-containing protein [Desulfurivibrio alkaliphilus]